MNKYSFSGERKYLCERTQKLCERMQNFSGECQSFVREHIFARECKSLASTCKVSWFKVKLLWANAKFLGKKANIFAREHNIFASQQEFLGGTQVRFGAWVNAKFLRGTQISLLKNANVLQLINLTAITRIYSSNHEKIIIQQELFSLVLWCFTSLAAV